jgi:peptidoglycan/xylan/chitin deacetylase (PgdA/CDA1 family)
MPISKRQCLSQAMNKSGLLWLLERVIPRRGLLIWNYHRIGSSAGNPFDDGVYSATAEQLRRQIRYLQSRFRIITMDECVRAAENGFPATDGPMAMITFDDGYRDNYELAFPVLKECGIPAAFFVPTGYLAQPIVPWWDRIAYVLKKTAKDQLSLSYPSPMHVELRSVPRGAAIDQVLRIYKSAPELNDIRFFQELESQAAVEVDERALGRDLFMNWDQLRELSGAGMTIGAHTVNHPILARLTESEQRYELAESKHQLEHELKQPVDAVAYPVGGKSAFADMTKRIAGELGYRLGFSFYGGINWPGDHDCLDLRRCAVDASTPFEMLRAQAVFYSAFGKSMI